jgi:secernin
MMMVEVKKKRKYLMYLFHFRLILKGAVSAESAVNAIAKLVDQNEQAAEISASPKYSFFICDNNEAYVLDVIGKLWVAEKIESSFRVFSGDGLSVKTKIDRKCAGLEEKLKELGLYDGSGELSFSEAVSTASTDRQWPCDEPTEGFSAQQMFEVLRASSVASERDISSSFVSILSSSVSVHWFTATPNPSESVFKPFIFTPNARISPLTNFRETEDETLLRQLHAKKNWEQVGELLKSLEKSCVNEIDGYLDNVPIDELDELLKDCVEAEVKFYR